MVSETTTLAISKNNNKNNTDDVMSETKNKKKGTDGMLSEIWTRYTFLETQSVSIKHENCDFIKRQKIRYGSYVIRNYRPRI